MAAAADRVDIMTETDEYKNLEATLQASRSRGCSWRNLLAVHTSTCCQRFKANGLVPTLNDCGINLAMVDGAKTFDGDGLAVYVELKLDKLFDCPRGAEASLPKLSLICRGPSGHTLEDAQEAMILSQS
jgi:hypothetical protein